MVRLDAMSASPFCEIPEQRRYPLGVVVQEPGATITPDAQEASHDACAVAVVYVEVAPAFTGV